MRPGLAYFLVALLGVDTRSLPLLWKQITGTLAAVVTGHFHDSLPLSALPQSHMSLGVRQEIAPLSAVATVAATVTVTP